MLQPLNQSATLVPLFDVKVDATQFRHTLKVFSAVMGRSFGRVVKDQAAKLASDMLNYTVPVEGGGGKDDTGKGRGTSKVAREIGMATLNASIDHIFKPLHKASYEEIASQPSYAVFAAWVNDRWTHQKKAGLKRENLNPEGWAAFQSAHAGGSGRRADFSAVNQGEGVIRQIHVQQRGGTDKPNYNSAVKRRTKSFFVDDWERKIPAYKKEAEKRVGRLKAGWAEACRALGRQPKSARWIDQNQSGTGYAIDNSSDTTKPSVTIANRIHFLMGTGAGTTLWHYAYHYRAFAMRSDIAAKLNKIANGNPITLKEAMARLNMPEGFQIK